MRHLWLLGLALLGGAAPALAESAAANLLRERIAGQVGQDWNLRVRWREQALVAFLSPPTVQESFNLAYSPGDQESLVERLCPQPDDPLWHLLTPQQDIAIEMQVLGKGGLRISCRATERPDPAA
jgi:hypothetical protein